MRQSLIFINFAIQGGSWYRHATVNSRKKSSRPHHAPMPPPIRERLMKPQKKKHLHYRRNNGMNIKNLLLLAIIAIIAGSCNTTKDVPYVIDAGKLPPEVLQAASKATDQAIMPGDLLDITVTSFNAEAVKPFNRGSYHNAESGALTQSSGNGQDGLQNYLVDSKGDIEFPLLGKLHVGGMTKSAIESLIASQIYPKYLTERPGVEVRLRNFHVSILGEVNSPGVISSQNERLNILEAIAQAGDLTIQGKRNNVLVVSTNADGSRSVRYVNLNDKNLLVSPGFYLNQNDIIYVEPNASKARSSWSVPPALTLTVSSIGTLISIATFIITLTK